MGNCQAAEAATVVIQHPGGKVERTYWSLSARQVMAANPGHYVAVIINSNPSRPPPLPAPSSASSSACHDTGGRSTSRGCDAKVKHLKLLRPDDTLHIGHVYCLVSFEEVLKEFASKRHVKLSRLLAKQEKTSRSRGGDGSSRSGATSAARLSRRQSCHRGGSRAAEPHTAPATEEQVKVEEARVEAELQEVVQGMMAMGSITTTTSRSARASVGGGAAGRHGQWRPALQSIAEVGS